jgi:predicted kinase
MQGRDNWANLTAGNSRWCNIAEARLSEEPGAKNPHAGICAGGGWVTALPTATAAKRNIRSNILATLHLMVGLPFSGKTTLARKLERECSALRLTTDEWHVLLFGQDAKEPDHDARHSLIEAMLWKIASRSLELGANVILDFGFWAREEREDYRLRAKQLGASSEVHFLDVSEDELLRRLEERNSQPSHESFYISVVMMKPWIEFFQRPTPDELVRRE